MLFDLLVSTYNNQLAKEKRTPFGWMLTRARESRQRDTEVYKYFIKHCVVWLCIQRTCVYISVHMFESISDAMIQLHWQRLFPWIVIALNGIIRYHLMQSNRNNLLCKLEKNAHSRYTHREKNTHTKRKRNAYFIEMQRLETRNNKKNQKKMLTGSKQECREFMEFQCRMPCNVSEHFLYQKLAASKHSRLLLFVCFHGNFFLVMPQEKFKYHILLSF